MRKGQKKNPPRAQLKKSRPTSSSLSSKIYIVALPIGNILDLSPRARAILKEADIIAAEDTRSFYQFIIDANEIDFFKDKQLVSYHDHNERDEAENLLQKVLAGKSLALVSDAGTPQISDPGYHLVKRAYELNIQVEPIPGPCSPIAALSACPIGGKSFLFAGFAPNDEAKLKQELIKNSASADRVIYFESPHRFVSHLKTAQELWKNEKIFIGREMTKKYQEYQYMEIPDLLSYFQSPKGEFVIIYPGKSTKEMSLEDLKNEIQRLIQQSLKPSEILENLKKMTSMTRRQLYDLITEIKHNLKNKSS